MLLVNANLKMLLGGKSQSFGLTMLRHVAVSNQLAGRREFSAAHVAKALLIDQVNTEGLTLWLHLNKEEGGLPLTKTLEAQTELAPAQYQFKHLSFQEGAQINKNRPPKPAIIAIGEGRKLRAGRCSSASPAGAASCC